MAIRSPKTFCGARKTPGIKSARCADTPTYPVCCSIPSSSQVMLVGTALGGVRKVKEKMLDLEQNVQFGAAKVHILLQNV